MNDRSNPHICWLNCHVWYNHVPSRPQKFRLVGSGQMAGRMHHHQLHSHWRRLLSLQPANLGLEAVETMKLARLENVKATYVCNMDPWIIWQFGWNFRNQGIHVPVYAFSTWRPKGVWLYKLQVDLMLSLAQVIATGQHLASIYPPVSWPNNAL